MIIVNKTLTLLIVGCSTRFPVMDSRAILPFIILLTHVLNGYIMKFMTFKLLHSNNRKNVSLA